MRPLSSSKTKKVILAIVLVFGLSTLGTFSFLTIFPIKSGNGTVEKVVQNSDTFATVDKTTENVPLLTNTEVRPPSPSIQNPDSTTATENKKSKIRRKPKTSSVDVGSGKAVHNSDASISSNTTVSTAGTPKSSDSISFGTSSISIISPTSSTDPFLKSSPDTSTSSTDSNSMTSISDPQTINSSSANPVNTSTSKTSPIISQSIPEPVETTTDSSQDTNTRIYPVNRMVGLQNLNNTCYANVIIQMLYHISDFRKSLDDYLALKASDETITQDIFAQRHHSAAKGLKAIFDLMDSAKEDENGKLFVKPVIHAAVRSENILGQQFDAAEVLTYYTEFKGFDWSAFTFSLKTTSIKYQLLDGFSTPDEPSHTYFKTQELLLDFPIQRNRTARLSLSEIITENLALRDRDLDIVDIEKGHHKATLQYFIAPSELPKILVIRLKRFNFDGTKISDKVSADEILDLQPFLDHTDPDNTGKACKYRIVSYVVHIEEVYYQNIPKTETTPERKRKVLLKHYVSYFRSNHDQFTKIDDSTIIPKDYKEFMEKAQDGYIYFYERIDNDNT